MLAVGAVRAAKTQETSGWREIVKLSPRASLVELETFDNELIIRDDTFQGSVLWHVQLKFADGDDEVVLTDSFPGIFSGMFVDDAANLMDVTADTSGFFR